MKNSNTVTRAMTRAMLDRQIAHLNRLMNTPENPWTHNDGKNTANVGCFHLCCESNSFYLYQIENESGGVRKILWARTKREMLGKIEALFVGLELRKNKMGNKDVG